MALPNPWTAISPGDIIKYDDHLTDLRTNIDFLDDNAANVADDSTIYGSQYDAADLGADTTVDTSDNISAQTDYDNNIYSTANTGVYSNKDATNYSTQHSGRDSAQDAGYDGSLFSSYNVYNYISG
jgi:hypothetical protein